MTRRPSAPVLVLLTGLWLAGCGGNAPAPRTVSEPPSPSAPPSATATASTTASPSRAAPSTPAAPSASRSAQGAPSARPIAYVFPVSPASVARYGRTHHDYPASDIFAPCGTAAVSPVRGRVSEVSYRDTWTAAVDDGATRGGLSVAVVGDDGVRYYGSHLSRVAPGIRPGVRVAAGQSVGRVGDTGSAAGTGCHLHFGISPPCGTGDWQVRRGILQPAPYLDAWRAREHRSPVTAVADWRRSHRARCP